MKPTAKLKKSQTEKGHGGLVKTKLASLLRRLATRLDGADDNETALRLAGAWATRFAREVLKKDVLVVPAVDAEGHPVLAVTGESDEE